MNIKTIYVIHYSKLKERKKNIQKHFKDHVENINFIEDFDQENINLESKSNQYNADKEKYYEKVKLWGENAVDFYELSKGEISCAYKHIEALKKLSTSNEELGLILEDDVIPLSKDFMKNIQEILNANSNWDIVFIGSGIGKEFINSKLTFLDKLFRRKLISISHPATNCAESYIVKKSTAKAIFQYIEEFNMAWDWELAYILKELNLKVMWCWPPIFEQGSKNGLFNSELR